VRADQLFSESALLLQRAAVAQQKARRGGDGAEKRARSVGLN